MIPRLNRLPSVNLVSSQIISSPLFNLRYTKNNLTYPRFAFVVSKRIDKRAVFRNRLKRILREVAYEEMLKSKRGVDLLFIVRKNFIGIPRVELEQAVIQSIGRINV